MPRFVIRKLKVRKPPNKHPSKVRLDPRPKPKAIANVDNSVTSCGTAVGAMVFNSRTGKKVAGPFVIKPPPSKARQRSADLAEKAAARKRYREAAGVVMDDCLDNLEILDELGLMYTVTLPNGAAREVQGFTVTGLGEALKTSGATVTRWLKRGMLPEPFLETSRGHVYHIEEAREMVRLIGNHQREFRQYRDDHEDVKDAIFEAVFKVRSGLFPHK